MDKTWQRFWSRIEKTESCWIWKGSTNGRGYGHFRYDGKLRYTHRLAYTYCVGPIPGGLLVLHKCDNPPCCNPGHLFLGSHKDNIQDAIQKGRFRWVRERAARLERMAQESIAAVTRRQEKLAEAESILRDRSLGIPALMAKYYLSRSQVYKILAHKSRADCRLTLRHSH